VSAPDRRTLLLLAGAALLAALSIAAVPFSRGLFRAPRTPFDVTDPAFTAPAWVLLQRAHTVVPPGSSVVVRTEPRDTTRDMYLHRFAIALLPGREILPAALWGVSTAAHLLEDAEYRIVLGRAPSPPPGRLVLEIPEGTIWRRAP
jgi:hypothetical protein